MCVPGIVGKVEGRHEQPKLHLSHMYTFYYHFIPPQWHLTSPMYISQGRSSGFPSSINLLYQNLPPGLGKAHLQGLSTHGCLQTQAKSFGMQADEGLGVIWDKTRVPGAWSRLGTELPTQRRLGRGTGSCACTHCPRSWEQPPHYCFPSGRLLWACQYLQRENRV